MPDIFKKFQLFIHPWMVNFKTKANFWPRFAIGYLARHCEDNIDHGVEKSSKGLVHLAREGEGCCLMADENHNGDRQQQQSHFFLDMMGYVLAQQGGSLLRVILHWWPIICYTLPAM